jgi:hypothetical protein
VTQRVRERDEFVPAGHFPFRHRVALLTDEPAQVRGIYGGRTLRASPARLRPAASASPAQSVPSAVIAWAGHRLGALANRCQLAVPLPMPCPRSRCCLSRRNRDR